MRTPTRALGVALAAVGIAVSTPSVARESVPIRHQQRSDAAAFPAGCASAYTAGTAREKIRRAYSSTAPVSPAQRRRLAAIEGCLENPAALAGVLRANRRARRAWKQRRQLSYGVASQYDDSGATASGFHARYGVAVCGSGGGPCVPFGTRILIVYHGRSVVAIADDHGPYIGGRILDLSNSTAGAIGFSGLDTVGYRIGG